MFAGVAGVLYIHYNGFVGPTDVGFITSGNIILMVLIGGAGTLWGGAIGSVVFVSLAYFVSLFTPERWPLIMGVCFVAVVMLLRGGIWRQLLRLWAKAR